MADQYGPGSANPYGPAQGAVHDVIPIHTPGVGMTSNSVLGNVDPNGNLNNTQMGHWFSEFDPTFNLNALQIPEIMQLAQMAYQRGWSVQTFENMAYNSNAVKEGLLSAAKSSIGGGGGGRGGGGGGASKADQIASIKAELHDMAGKLGLPITDQELTYIATNGFGKSYTTTQYSDALLALPEVNQKAGTSTINVSADQIKQMGQQFMVPLSDATAQDYALKIAKGELDVNGVQSVLQAQATARFSWMGDLIKQGVKPIDYLNPIRDTIANTLELDPNAVNLNDPNYAQYLEKSDPKTGLTRAVTLTEAQAMARQDPRWAGTQNARDLASSWAVGLKTAFAR